jgi:hypothetical protein
MKTKTWYLVGDIHGGCGHDHGTTATARKCLLKLRKRGGRGSVYKVRRDSKGFHARRIVRESR